jgi:hypothetical protein
MEDKFEIVVACVNHAHFLRETLPINKRKVERVVVVTTPTDYETQKVCIDNDVDCIKTDLFYKDGAHFNRGLALNEAFNNLKDPSWVLHLDSDIVLPRGYEEILNPKNKNLKLNTLYGARRVEISDREEYLALLKEFALFYAPRPVGELIDKPEEVCCGFFQLFNINSECLKFIKDQTILFPEAMMNEVQSYSSGQFSNIAKSAGDIYPSFPTCGGSDIHFRAFWENKVEIAVPVFHLGKERDHSGRKVFKF